MYHINFNRPTSVHFIGIGGISMSGLAEILLKAGFVVSGSDAQESDLTNHLASIGAKIFIGQKAENVAHNPAVVVYTAAIHPDNPEYAAAEAKGLPLLSRADLLGQLMQNYTNSVGISGTHGKTTTTSMFTEILLAAHTDPTISVGGILPTIGGNIRVGGHDLFVTEACEYTNSFLSFYPSVEAILNIEADHLDFFKDLEDIRHSFHLYAEKLDDKGILVINHEIDRLEEFVSDLPCHVITFGLEKGGDYLASHIEYDEFGFPSFLISKKTEEGYLPIGTIVLQVPGVHNIYNAMAAYSLAASLHIGHEDIAEGLHHFTGTQRRFQKKGELNGVTVIDDYAHHPAEITATLQAAARYPHKKLWCVFQPHTYTRTKALLDDFARALTLADEVVLAKIYPARETDDLGISSATLAEAMAALGKKAIYLETFEEIVEYLYTHCTHNDLLITMGAGNVVNIGEMYLKQ